MAIEFPAAFVTGQRAFRYDEEIHVAVGGHAATGIRTEENDALRSRGFADLFPDPLNVCLLDHDCTLASGERYLQLTSLLPLAGNNNKPIFRATRNRVCVNPVLTPLDPDENERMAGVVVTSRHSS